MNPTSIDPGAKRSRLFLFLGMSSLLLMAFFSALDGFFIYVFLGAGAFFFFLAVWHFPWKSSGSSSQQWQQTKARQQTSQRSDGIQTSAVKIIKVAAMIFVGFFLFLFIVGIIVGPEEDAAYLFTKAEEFRTLEQYDSARKYYRKASRVDPDDPNALNGLGIVWLNERRYDSALFYFDKAVDRDESFEYGRYNKALAYYYQKNNSRALDEVLKLVDMNPYYNDALQLTGDIYYEQKNLDKAKEWYDKAYDNGLCHVLGYLYDTKGDTEKAIHLYQESVSYDPYKTDVFTRLGELLPGAEGEEYRMTAAQLKKDGY
jgi:predicted Zn-dependent protease